MDKKITYTNEVVDSYSGQTNCEAGVYANDEIVGLVQYVLFEDELSISHIFVRPEFRRLGYGSKLMKYIKEQNPDYHYVPSLKTDLGAAFKHKDVSLTEKQHFEREGTPLDKLGIGENRFKPLVIDFLKVIENSNLLIDPGFMNVGQDIITSDRLFDGFHELVTTWPKYKPLVNSMGLEIQNDGVPDLDETIFVSLKEKPVSKSLSSDQVIMKQLRKITDPIDNKINPVPMVPFRSVVKEVTRNNFHISTQADYKEIHLTSHFENIHHLWSTLSDKGTNFKSRGGSQYWISDKAIYRLADHWGGVASCFWTIDGEGDPNFQTKKEGPFRIGWAFMKDFSPYTVNFKRDNLIDPKWCDKIRKPLKEALEDLEEIKKEIWEEEGVSGEVKGFIGKHIYRYKNIVNDIERNDRRIK
jgi:GNAT superfamily N-acetyltransferase